MDNVDRKTRSETMSKVRSENTRLERMFFDLLTNAGFPNFSTHDKELIGAPDVVFRDEKVLVFLDSCYWHGCPQHLRMPSSNVEYWRNKIRRNKTRDRRQRSELRKSGWRVVRIWEHELKNPAAIKRKIQRIFKTSNKKINLSKITD